MDKKLFISLGLSENRKIKKCKVIEIDEMWHYLGKKNKKYGYEFLFAGRVDKSLDGKLVVVEENSKKTNKKIVRVECEYYATDKWKIYQSIIAYG